MADEIVDPIPPPKEGWVNMQHPDTGGVTTVSRKAFDAVWCDLGWVIVEAEDPAEHHSKTSKSKTKET